MSLTPRHRAGFVFIENLRALLEARHLADQDLAFWCHHQPAWISKLLAGKHKGVKFADLDRIADLLGVEIKDLFGYGHSSRLERRRKDRRQGQERRVTDRRGQPREEMPPDDHNSSGGLGTVSIP